MAIKCENQSFKIHKLAFEKDGFKKFGAWTSFKNEDGEWHDVYFYLLFSGSKADIELAPQSRIKIDGGMKHYKRKKKNDDGTFFEGWSVFVDECEVVQMGGEQGSRRKPMSGMDDVPF